MYWGIQSASTMDKALALHGVNLAFIWYPEFSRRKP